MIQVIVNVDDLGMHPAVARATRALAEAGSVTSASVLANSPFLEGARGIVGISFGAHLNLLRGRPTSTTGEVSSLVGKSGMFPGSLGAFLRRYLSGALDLAQVELEWGRQIEALIDSGFSVTHLDSEKHLHALPTLHPIVTRLARRYGIARIRRPYERSTPGGSGFDWLKTGVLRRLSKGIAIPQYYVWGLVNQGERLSLDRFQRYLEEIPDGSVVEVCCHPGRSEVSDPALPSGYEDVSIHGGWEDEFRALSRPEWARFIQGFIQS